jgi:hypothetical protein
LELQMGVRTLIAVDSLFTLHTCNAGTLPIEIE